VDNVPTPGEMIALNQGGTVTLTFSETVQDLYFALVSWNSQQPGVIDFGQDVILVSEGQGFWGNGSVSVNANGTGIDPVGEYHGVIKILGSYDSLSFQHISENWHGFTVGVAGLAPPPPPPGDDVPEPGMLSLLGLGFAALGVARRRRQRC
jgi:hypothetical protein